MNKESDNDPLDLKGFEEEIKKAKLREEKRDAMRNILTIYVFECKQCGAKRATWDLA